jgi:flagellar FliL protein
MTETATPKSPAQEAPPPPAKKKRGRLIVFLFVGVVVLVGGAVTARMLLARKAASPDAPAKPVEHGLLTLEPFVVNLADPGVSRFLRVSVRLIVGTAAQAEEIQKNDVTLTRIRSAILELLTQQTADRLVTAEGKTALKLAIATRASEIVEGTTVTDVLFSDFVVQF